MSRYQTLLSQAKATIQEIQPEAVAQESSPNSFIVDVREDSEWEKGHIPEAIHLSRGILEGNIERLAPDVTSKIIVYCAGGARSALAAESLMRMGYKNVFSMYGGFGSWQEHGLPIAKDK